MASKMSQWSQPFTPWPNAPNSPYNRLEPYGNPAYEGIGWPGTGYGILRRQAVPLPNGIALTQTSAQGYDPVDPRMDRVFPQGRVDVTSSDYAREVVGSLGSLAYYPVQDSMDAYLSNTLKGLSQIPGVAALVGSGALTLQGLQSLATALSVDIKADAPGLPATTDVILGAASGKMPQSFVDKLTEKLISDDAYMNAAYQRLQEFKKLPAKVQPTNMAQLQKQQEDVFSKVNTAKYYALLLPAFQKSLGFTDGKPKVVPPDYNYIKAKADSSVSTKVAQWLRDKTVASATQQLINAGYVRGSLNGLSGVNGLGELVIAGLTITGTGIVIVLLCVVALVGFFVWYGAKKLDADMDMARQESDNLLNKACQDGTYNFDQCVKLKELQIEADKAYADRKNAGKVDWDKIVMYGAIGIGAIVALRLALLARDTFQSRSAQPALPAPAP